MLRDFLQKAVVFVHFDGLSLLINFKSSIVLNDFARCIKVISLCFLGAKHFLGKDPALQIAFGHHLVAVLLEVTRVASVAAAVIAITVLGYLEDLLSFQNPHVCLAWVIDLVRV